MQTAMTGGERQRFAAYLDSLRRRGRKDATLDSYRDAHTGFCRFITDTDGTPADLSKVTGADIRAWKNCLLRLGRAANTINHRLLSIEGYAEWALMTGEMTTAQVESIRAIPLVETPELGAVTLEPDEQRRFIRAVERCPSRRDQAIVFMLLGGGLRLGEIANLKVDDITLTTSRGLVRVRGEHVKRSAQRTVPLTARARHYLRAYLEETKPTGAVFIGQRGPLTESGIDKIIRRLGEDAGVDVHAHLMRHEFSAAFLAENPGDLSGLSKVLGHASVETTARHYDRRRLSDLAASVERIQT